MDYNNLNDKEVIQIIKRLKYPKRKFAISDIYREISALFGKIDIDEVILDDDGVKYILHIFRGKRNSNRFSIHLRFKEINDHIVRVNINPSNRHLNPNGDYILGSHIHIYSNQYSKRDSLAVPLEESDFPNVNTIVEAVSHFIDYTNIVGDDNND